jgi:hypothetical protein
MEKTKLRLPALILLVASILFWSQYDRYEPDGPMLLQWPALAEASSVRGDVSEADGRFVLHVPAAGKTAELRFRLPTAKDYSSIRVRGRIKVDGVVVGQQSWNCARLLVVQYDARDKWISGHHGVVAEEGFKDWEKHEDIFEIFPGAARADVVLQQSGTAGRAEFDQIEAQPVRTRTSFVWWRCGFAALWLAAAFLYFPRCRLHRRKLKVLIFLNAVAILVGTLMPSTWIENVAEQSRETVALLRPAAPEKPAAQSPATPTKKIVRETSEMDLFNMVVGDAHRTGHFALFASLCFLVYLSAALERQHPVYFFKVGFDILLFAAVTESLQYLTLDRTAGIGDLLTDVYGLVTALLVFLLVLPLVRRFQSLEKARVA